MMSLLLKCVASSLQTSCPSRNCSVTAWLLTVAWGDSLISTPIPAPCPKRQAHAGIRGYRTLPRVHLKWGMSQTLLFLFSQACSLCCLPSLGKSVTIQGGPARYPSHCSLHVLANPPLHRPSPPASAAVQGPWLLAAQDLSALTCLAAKCPPLGSRPPVSPHTSQPILRCRSELSKTRI